MCGFINKICLSDGLHSGLLLYFLFLFLAFLFLISITINLFFFIVIDFCLTKQNEVDPETNYQRLMLQWASKASLTQRKGKGICFCFLCIF